MTAVRPYLPAWPTAAGFGAYVALAVALHALAGAAHVWPVAALMMVLMTVTYPTEAALAGRFFRLEASLALALSAVAVVGLITSPLLIVAAIFAHGLLDLMKLRGLGVPFYRAYLLGCGAFDFAYGSALLIHHLTSGGSL